MHVVRLIFAVVVFTFVYLPRGTVESAEAERLPITASKVDKCPVCGMFVAKYPDFLAQILFTDGTYALFDGAKDMFKYYFNMKKYNAAKNHSDVAFIYVTDYYSIAPADGRKAWYVAGSDVFGPMGSELMPFVQETDAKEFMKDHHGKKLISFGDVTDDVIHGLD